MIVVLDEAYTEFTHPSERVNSFALLEKYPNLIVSRSLSKAYGLAGLRIGYAVSNPEIADLLNRVRQPFNCNLTGESGAGLVKITINGAHNCRRIEIDPSLMEDDKEMLEDLIAAAFNDAVRRAEELQKEKMASVTAGMPLPPGFKMPF